MRTFVVSGLALAVTVAAVACGTQGSSSNNDNGGAGNGSSTAGAQGNPSSSASNQSVAGSNGGATSTAAQSAASSSPSETSDGGAGSDGSPPAGSLPALHVSGNQIVDANGNVVVLRGVAIPDIGLLYAGSIAGEFPDGGSIAGVTGRIDEILGAAGLNAKVVRLPVYPRTVPNGGTGFSVMASPAPYPVGLPPASDAGILNLLPADYIAQILKPAVDYVTSKNLYAIVDYHQIDNSISGTTSNDAESFWNEVAPVFANYPNVIYEAFNEPIDTGADGGIAPDGGWSSSFIGVAQGWIKAIRAQAPNNLIIVGSPSWSQYPSGALGANLTGGNLVFTAHAYPDNWPGTKNAFQDRVTSAATAVPIAMTEWGFQIGTASPGGGGLATPNDAWGQALQAVVDDAGVSWTAWVADPSWGPPMFDKPTGMDENGFVGLTDFGTFVQGWLAGGTAIGDGGADQ